MSGRPAPLPDEAAAGGSLRLVLTLDELLAHLATLAAERGNGG
jgi:hypothetical protein